ncbi:hypothetical protein BSKO_03662 [Bryopsis sp. KO-2023]|nr:hypothetical protein BSKO_03662 [Bryopsis sp. KO-2023]
MYALRNHPTPPNPDLWGSVARPLPTNAWWLNFVIQTGEGVTAPLPFNMRARGQGMVLCFPWVTVSETVVFPPFIENIRVLVEEQVESRKVVAFDDLSATLEWRKTGGGGSLTLPVVRGAPYATFIFDNLTPKITTQHAIVNIVDANPTGTRFEVFLNNGQKWLIYSSHTITMQFANNEILASAPFTGVLRVAIVPPGERESLEDLSPDTSFEPWLDDHRHIYPTGGSAVMDYEGDMSNLRFEFTTQSMVLPSSGDLLMMAMPHHLDTGLETAGMGNVYRTTYGFLTGVLGATWQLPDTLPTIGWTAPRSIDSSRVEAVRAALLEDVPVLETNAPDPYFFGKEISAMGRLALIADELGETSVAGDCRERMKQEYMPWLMGQNDDAYVYDEDWGGIVPTNGLADMGADFGAGYYNDHHFHQGYHIYAIAAIARGDPTFLANEENKRRALDLVRNFANPNRNDPYYTFARHKDFYVGHSWASGIIPNFGVRANQESTSEAINAYYAVQLIGQALGDINLENFGRIMLGLELRSARKYWLIKSSDNIYPEPFASNKVVGIRWPTKADYATFFGANAEFIFGIQFLPFTPISEIHLDATWVEEAYPRLSPALETAGEGWRGFIFMAHAVIDPMQAWMEVNQLQGYDNGNSKTNTLYWVATRPNGMMGPNPSPMPPPNPPPSPSPSPPPSPPSSPPSGDLMLTNRELELAHFIINAVYRTIGDHQVTIAEVTNLAQELGGSQRRRSLLGSFDVSQAYTQQLPLFWAAGFPDQPED